MEKVLDLGNGITIWKANVDEFREQDLNARVMDKAKFERLKKNIEEDSRLESLPLSYIKKNPSGNEELGIISGHHRIRAARMANVLDIYTLVLEEDLSDDEIKAKQLAHNALNGVDDPQILKMIYDSIENVKERIRSGVIEEEISKVYKQVHIDEINLDFKYEIVRIIFLESQFDKFEKAAKLIDKNERTMVASYEDFDKIAEGIRKVSNQENIRNVAAIMLKMSEITLEYYASKTEVQERVSETG